MPIRLYLSQANQGHNGGPNGYTEKAGMDAISKLVAAECAKDKRFITKRNVAGSRVDTASENGLEANRWGADLYVALHSNAGGAGARGTFGFYHSKASFGYKVARGIVNRLSPISPGGGKVLIEKPGFIELHTPRAPAALIEIEAHDWAPGVKFLTGEKARIAQAIYAGICDAYGYSPVLNKPKPKPAPKLDYRPLKRAAVKVAGVLGIKHPGVGVSSNKKGEPFAKLLCDIADHK